jgi:hypothetical protein
MVSVSKGEYRYGMNTQEKDNEIYGEGNSYSAEYWQYDARLGRRWNVDPVVKVHESPYATFANNPIWFVDPSGADTSHASTESASLINNLMSPTIVEEKSGLNRFFSKTFGLSTNKTIVNPNYNTELADIVQKAVENKDLELHFTTERPSWINDPNVKGAMTWQTPGCFMIYWDPKANNDNSIGANPLFEEIIHFDNAQSGIAGYFNNNGFMSISNGNLLKEEARAKHRVVNLQDNKGRRVVTSNYDSKNMYYLPTSYAPMISLSEAEILKFISTGKGKVHDIEVSVYDPVTRNWNLKVKTTITHPQEGVYQHLLE